MDTGTSRLMKGYYNSAAGMLSMLEYRHKSRKVMTLCILYGKSVCLLSRYFMLRADRALFSRKREVIVSRVEPTASFLSIAHWFI